MQANLHHFKNFQSPGNTKTAEDTDDTSSNRYAHTDSINSRALESPSSKNLETATTASTTGYSLSFTRQSQSLQATSATTAASDPVDDSVVSPTTKAIYIVINALIKRAEQNLHVPEQIAQTLEHYVDSNPVETYLVSILNILLPVYERKSNELTVSPKKAIENLVEMLRDNIDGQKKFIELIKEQKELIDSIVKINCDKNDDALNIINPIQSFIDGNNPKLNENKFIINFIKNRAEFYYKNMISLQKEAFYNIEEYRKIDEYQAFIVSLYTLFLEEIHISPKRIKDLINGIFDHEIKEKLIDNKYPLKTLIKNKHEIYLITKNLNINTEDITFLLGSGLID